MAQEHKEDFDINQSIDKAEAYVRDNKRSLSIIGGAALVILLSYFGYTNFIVKPQEEEARKQMFMAEKYFGKDSLKLALKGDGSYPGMEEIAEQYGSSPSGNLAHYYLGMIYLKNGTFQKAIDELKSYDAEDDVTGAFALGGIGAAYVELGNLDDGLKYYKKAADWDQNQFTRPYFLMKAALVLEAKKDFTSAIDIYNQVIKDYPTTQEGREAEKYLGRALALAGK